MARPFKAIPGPKGLPIIGSILDYSKFGKHSFEKLHLAKQENYVKYGKIYKEKVGPGINIVQIFDPEDLGAILHADGKIPLRPAIPVTIAANKRDGFALGLGSLNGEAWYKLRSSVQKLMMRPKAVSAYLPAQNDVANDFLQMIKKTDTSSEANELHQLISKYTMESIGIVCFGTRLGCLSTKLAEGSVAHRMFDASGKMFRAIQITTFAFPWYFLFRTKMYKQFTSAKTECDSIARSHINDTIHQQSHSVDDINSANKCPHFLNTLLAEERLDAETVVGITTDLFTAGIDSTANALSFVIYNLSRNPEKQEKLAAEILSVLGTSQTVTTEAIDHMHYLKAVVKESFRLNFPVEGGTTRILSKDSTISNYTIPKNTIIAFNNQTMCLQEEYFEHAREFIPERWLKDGSASLKPPPRFVMLPFGHGPRMCIGRRFAEQEIYLALIKIIQNFRVEYIGTEEVGMVNRVFTMPDRPIKVNFIQR